MLANNSSKLFQRAQKVMPGGVSSPVRAFRAVGGEPIFIDKAQGSRLFDVDGKEYIDFVGSWGPMILGHAHPEVLRLIHEAVDKGTSFGAPNQYELQLAEMVTSLVPSVDVVRFVNSGTEATMSAVRLARAVTSRDLVVKFDGCYHGHADFFLVAAGSGAMTLGQPDSLGVPNQIASLTASLPYNDIEHVTTFFQERGNEIAAVIVEPVAGNMGVVLPKQDFLAKLRELTSKYGALLIFDEVITGFRLSLGGAQQLFDIKPDITTLGKIIGGGLPVGAYGGTAEIMNMLAPNGPVYQAGTLSGNPIAMAAGYKTIHILQQDEGVYERLDYMGSYLEKGLQDAAKDAGVGVTINRAGSMLTIFFSSYPVSNYQDAKRSDTTMFAKFHSNMLAQGIYLPPSQFEAWFLSTAHTREDLDRTIEAAYTALKKI
nr:glutamate-1-semialdehyde 2,1-aminomutase [Thermobaculum terrenum]